MAERTVVQGSIRKPSAKGKGGKREAVVNFGIRGVGKSGFERGPDAGTSPNYIGPSTVMGRGSSVAGGSGQKKKHKGSGKGQ